MLSLVREICSWGSQVIIIDDGSGERYSEIFLKLESMPNVTVIRHAVNLGKGQALKTAFNEFLLHFSIESLGVHDKVISFAQKQCKRRIVS